MTAATTDAPSIIAKVWRSVAAAALVLAAVVWLVFAATEEVLWLQGVTFGLLAVALAMGAVGHPGRQGTKGKIGLLLLTAACVVFVAGFFVGDLLGSGWTPVIIIGLTLYALFGVGMIVLIADLVIALLAVSRKTEHVSFVPAALGATTFLSLMSVYLPHPDWFAYLLPVACVACAVYLLVGSKK